MIKYTLSLATITILCITSCTQTEKAPDQPDSPLNIIFLIGDGMGLSAVSVPHYYGDMTSQFDRFREIGLSITSSALQKITDSAASGTAMATGHKTYNGALGLDTMKRPVSNITDLVSGLGWSTGLVVTSSITHATPASFYAHVDSRSKEEEIALQLLDSEIDFFAGGGIRFFNHRMDGEDLFPMAREKGFIMDTVSLSEPASFDPENKYGYLLAEEGMPHMNQGRGDYLADALTRALQYLSLDEDGFFLMLEGSQIDWGGHDNDAGYLISETLDFNKVVGMALDFAEKEGNTLVVVTADHETGGFTLAGYEDEETGASDYTRISPSFSTGGHSTTLIPVFAYGPGSELFKGTYQNTGIYEKMARLVQ